MLPLFIYEKDILEVILILEGDIIMKKVSFRIRKFDKEQFLTYNIDNDASLDEEVLDFLEEEEPKGLVPIIFEEDEEFDTFSYNVTDKIRLCELSNQEINAEMVLKVMRGLVLSLVDMGEYRVPLSYLVLHRNYIYINSDYEVEFICVPLEDIQDEVDVNAFLRSFVASLRFDSSENGDYVARMLSYINNTAIFNLRNMVTLVEDLMETMGIEIPEDLSNEIYVDYQEVEDEEVVEASEEVIQEDVAMTVEEPEEDVVEDIQKAVEESEETEEAVEKPAETVEDIEEVAEELEETVEDVEGTVEEPETAVEDVEEAVEEPETAVEDVEEAVEEPEAAVEDVEEAVEEPEAAVEDVEEAVEEPEAAVEDVEEAVEEPEAAVEDVEEAVEEPEAAVEDVEEAVEEPEAVVEDIEEVAEEPEVAVEDVEEAVEEPEAGVEDIEEVAEEPEVAVEDIEEAVEEPEAAVEDTEELAKNEVFNTETDIDEDAKSIIESLKKKVEEEQHATVLEEVQKIVKKPTFKTKDTSSSGVVIEDDFDDFVAEMERAEKAAKHEETGLKIKKSIKVNRASVAKSNRDEIKEEVAVDNKVEEEVASNVIQSQTVAATAVVKTMDIPKANPYLVRVNTEERIMITKQNFKVGKASMGVDYTVKGNSAVSRVHAIIVNKDDTYYVKDNKSTNHTFVNGKILDEGENEPLTHDCKIVLGDEEFVFKLR